MSQHTKAHTFASRTSKRTVQSLQKSVLFTDPRRNSNFFLPPFGVLIFLQPHKPRQASNQKVYADLNWTMQLNTDDRSTNR